MFCLRKCIAKALTKSKPEYENLLEKEVKPDFRILLLGNRNSGKTTFLKQARKKYSGFTESECMEFKEEIAKVVYKTVAELVAEMKETKSQCDVDLEGDDIREIVKESEASIPSSFPSNHFETIKQFWRSASVKKCYENTGNTNGDYFLNNIARIADESYIPTVQDIMRVNTPSQALDTHILKINGIKFEVTDTPAANSKVLSELTDKKYDFIVYFVSLSQFKTAKTREELRELSENIASIRTMIDGLMSSASILLYFTQTQEYMHTQKYSQISKHDDYCWIAKDRVMRHFSRFIESVPNRVYNHFEDTNKLTNMKLVYELIKHQAIIRNLKQIHCSS